MLKRFRNSYYSKIMIVCIAAVCAITAILLPVCSSLIHQQELSEDLKKYDLILNRLTASMSSRQEALATNLTPIFSDEANYQNLCNFYRAHSKKGPFGISGQRHGYAQFLLLLRFLLLWCSASNYNRASLSV